MARTPKTYQTIVTVTPEIIKIFHQAPALKMNMMPARKMNVEMT
jgi:hypothetical protein